MHHPYIADRQENQALEAQLPFIFVTLRPRSKLVEAERKALEALKGGIVCPDNSTQRGIEAFDEKHWHKPGADFGILYFPKITGDLQ